MTNLVEDNLSYLSPHERERVEVTRKASQALGTCSANDFKAVIRMSLMHDNEVKTEDAALAKKAFGPDIVGLKGKNTQSIPFPVQSQAICIP